jgi:hypothetical protein
MTPTLIHRFWTYVEKTQSSVLLDLNDSDLTARLLGGFNAQQPLSHTQLSCLQDYITNRLSLIRELAEHRGEYAPGMA